MQPALLSLVLCAVHLSVREGCRAEQPPEQQKIFPGGRLSSEPSRPVRRGRSEHTGGVFLHIFHWRGTRWRSFNLNRELYNSEEKADWPLHRLWLDLRNQWRAFGSTTKGQLLRKQPSAHKDPPEPSSGLPDLLVKRTRRSRGVNPSDPLGSQSFPSHLARPHKGPSHVQHEQDQTGAVSKETIASCDDPLRVLQPNGPVSPVKTNIAEWAEQRNGR